MSGPVEILLLTDILEHYKHRSDGVVDLEHERWQGNWIGTYRKRNDVHERVEHLETGNVNHEDFVSSDLFRRVLDDKKDEKRVENT